MKNIIKKIFVVLFFSVLIISNSYNVKALSLSDIENSANDFIKTGSNQYDKIDNSSGISSNITSQVSPVVRILSVAGLLIIGCCMVVLGIQWVSARPSPEIQAKLKHRFVALAVAAGVMFGSYTIWSIVVSIMSSI